MNTQELLVAIGGQAAIARECEISESAVSQWVKDGLPKPRSKYLRLAHPGPHWAAYDAELARQEQAKQGEQEQGARAAGAAGATA